MEKSDTIDAGRDFVFGKMRKLSRCSGLCYCSAHRERGQTMADQIRSMCRIINLSISCSHLDCCYYYNTTFPNPLGSACFSRTFPGSFFKAHNPAESFVFALEQQNGEQQRGHPVLPVRCHTHETLSHMLHTGRSMLAFTLKQIIKAQTQKLIT